MASSKVMSYKYRDHAMATDTTATQFPRYPEPSPAHLVTRTPRCTTATSKRVLDVFYSRAGKINEIEVNWRDRYMFLLSQGYRLRPRYHPDWSPSWLGTSLKPWDCEDAIEHFVSSRCSLSWHRFTIFNSQGEMVIDACRKDAQIVCLKRTLRKSDEVEIGRRLSPDASKPDSKNHCVEILDIFLDPFSPDTYYIATPLMRPYDDPEFTTIGEVVDFVTQVLEVSLYLKIQLQLNTSSGNGIHARQIGCSWVHSSTHPFAISPLSKRFVEI